MLDLKITLVELLKFMKKSGDIQDHDKAVELLNQIEETPASEIADLSSEQEDDDEEDDDDDVKKETLVVGAKG